jgi:hypothetical protein
MASIEHRGPISLVAKARKGHASPEPGSTASGWQSNQNEDIRKHFRIFV